jgi:hypothetical protein
VQKSNKKFWLQRISCTVRVIKIEAREYLFAAFMEMAAMEDFSYVMACPWAGSNQVSLS